MPSTIAWYVVGSRTSPLFTMGEAKDMIESMRSFLTHMNPFLQCVDSRPVENTCAIVAETRIRDTYARKQSKERVLSSSPLMFRTDGHKHRFRLLAIPCSKSKETGKKEVEGVYLSAVQFDLWTESTLPMQVYYKTQSDAFAMRIGV